MDLSSSDDGLWEQPEGQSDPADMPSDDTTDAATYADSSNDSQLEDSEGQLPELAVSSSDEKAERQAESDNDELDRVSLAEIEQSDPFQIQSIEHDQDDDTSFSAQQAVDLDTFSTGNETSTSQHSTDTQTQAAQDKDLTFDQALAQATVGDDLSDDPNETSGNDSKGALTFDEALAATRGTESITEVIANSAQANSDSDNSTSETSVVDSLLPFAESVSDSLNATFGEADDASTLTDSISNDTSSSGVLSGLASSTVNAVSDKLSEATEASESLLQKGQSSVQLNSSAGNTTRDFLSGAASSAAGAVTAASSAASGLLSNATSALSSTNTSVVTDAVSAASSLLSNTTSAISSTANSSAITAAVTAASGLLSNASSALSTPVNTSTASATDAAGSLSVAGGAESDAVLPSEMLNSSVLNSSMAGGVMLSGMQKVGAAVSSAKSWLNSSSAEEDAVSAHSGATAGRIQEEPLTDLEQLEPGEEEDMGAGTAGLLATASTHAPPAQNSSSGTAAGSTPVHGSTQSRPAAQRPARPAAQGKTAALANTTSSQRAAAAELSTESDAGLSTQTSSKAAGHLGNRQQLPRTADQQTNTGVQSKTGASTIDSSSGRASGAGGGHNSSTDAVVAAAMANPKSSASAAAKAASLNSAAAGAVAEEEDDQMVGLSQARSGASAAQSKASAQPSALEAQRLRQEQEEEQEEEYMRQQAKSGVGSAAGSTAKASQQVQPVLTAAQSARTGYADDDLAAASRGQVQSDFDDDYADEIAVGRTSYGSAAAAASQLAKSKAQQTLANSGFDNDDAALEEDAYPSGLQGSGSSTGTQAAPIRQSGTAGTTASQQSHTATGRQAALAVGESDPASGGQGSSQAGGWPHTGVSSTSTTGIKSQPSTTTGFGRQYEDADMAEEEEGSLQPLGQTAISHAGQVAAAESARATSRDQPNALPSIRASSTGSDYLPGGKSGSTTSSASASDTRTPAQQRELEREMAFKASTGSSAQDLMDSKSSANSAASGQSLNALAGTGRSNTAAGGSTSSHAGGVGSSQSVNKRQQPLGGGESVADIGDYDPRGFAAGSTSNSITGTGQAASDALRTDSSSTGVGAGSRQGTALGGEAGDSRNFGVGSGLDTQARSGFGDEEESDSSSSFMVGRDPTNPTSVVGSQQSFAGQPHTVQQRTTTTNSAGMGNAAAGQVAAGKTKMSLEPDEDEETLLMAGSLTASQALGKMNSADMDKSGGSLAGPVVTSSSDEEFVAHPRGGSKQSSSTSSSLHSLLDNIINNWVVITALSVCGCTGAVLAFVFLRGSLPSPYDAVTFTNVGTSGYAGNGGGYTGLSREDQESGWENGWGNDDDAEVVSPNQKRSSSNSPPRGTGVGKLKKGTFAKKKPANWSNDF